MAVIAVKPFILKDVSLIVGTDNYEGHVSTVRFDPTSSTVNWKGLTPSAVFSFGTTPTWTVTLTYAQDWETENSLSQYLLENAGEIKDIVFKPQNPDTGTAPTFSATVLIQPGPIGGDVDAVASASVTLGLQGFPEKTTE